MRTVLPLALLLTALAGCSGGSPSGQAAAPLAAPPISGQVLDAGEGTLVFLTREDPLARDVYTLAGTLVDSTPVDADGLFAFSAGEGDGLLVSAPGKALARVPLGEGRLEIRLLPEARLTVQTGEPYAAALVLDAQGVPLPLPAAELVSLANGTLRVTRLPAGRCTLLVQSADGLRHAAREVSVSTGDERTLVLRPEDDLEAARRFLTAVGGPALEHPFVLGSAR